MTKDPKGLQNLPHLKTIYHQLLRPDAYRSGTVPSLGSLYDESQALLFGGADTTGTTLMHGSFYILTLPGVYGKLKAELLSAWPVPDDVPSLSELEKLPYLVLVSSWPILFLHLYMLTSLDLQTAIIKEALRISPGVVSPLPRVVPSSGAIIHKTSIPGDV